MAFLFSVVFFSENLFAQDSAYLYEIIYILLCFCICTVYYNPLKSVKHFPVKVLISFLCISVTTDFSCSCTKACATDATNDSGVN